MKTTMIMCLFLSACGGTTATTTNDTKTDSGILTDELVLNSCHGNIIGDITESFDYSIVLGDSSYYAVFTNDFCTNNAPAWCGYNNEENAFQCNAESVCSIDGEDSVHLQVELNPLTNRFQLIYTLPNVIGRTTITTDCSNHMEFTIR